MRCSKLGQDNPGLVQGLNSDLKAYKAYQFQFFFSTSWWLEALKITEKIIRENAFEDKKKKSGLNLTPC